MSVQPAGWYQASDGLWYFGDDPTPHASPSGPALRPPPPPPGVAYRGPARTAHGPVYWIVVGWWWQPITKVGRILLWVVFFPAGLWRSIVKSRKDREARERRGYRRS